MLGLHADSSVSGALLNQPCVLLNFISFFLFNYPSTAPGWCHCIEPHVMPEDGLPLDAMWFCVSVVHQLLLLNEQSPKCVNPNTSHNTKTTTPLCRYQGGSCGVVLSCEDLT
eukprot:4092785-Amphidinium_carterae.3